MGMIYQVLAWFSAHETKNYEIVDNWCDVILIRGAAIHRNIALLKEKLIKCVLNFKKATEGNHDK